MTPVIDPRAKQILFDTYWTSKGWTDHRVEPSAADRAHAIAHGLMLEPFTGTLRDITKRVEAAVEKLDVARVAGAFLASLSSRRLDLRSGLASYLIACNWAPADGDNEETYDGEDLDVLSFERHKWGGVRHGQALYTLVDLEALLREPNHVPTKEDIAIMNAILAAAAASPAKETPGKLAERLKDLLPSSKAERNTLVEILGATFVLVAKKERNGSGEFEHVADWRGEDGVNEAQVAALFGSFGVTTRKTATRTVSSAQSAAVKRPAAKKSAEKKPVSKRASATRRSKGSGA